MRRIDYTNALNARVNIEKRTIPATGVDNIALPVTAANTGMKAQLFGQSAENLVVNGDYSLNTPHPFSALNSTLIISDGTGKYTGSGNSGLIIARRNQIAGKYYVKARARVTDSICDFLFLRFGDAESVFSTVASITTPVANQWYELSAVGDSLSVASIRAEYADNATQLGKVMEIDYCHIIDLTATFGAGNEPSKEQCDKLFANYFEGTVNTIGTGRVRSVDADGENASTLYLNAGELRSTPTAKDEIRKGTNGYELVRRVGVGTLGANGITGGNLEGGLIGSKTDGEGSVSTWSINTVNPISGSQDGRIIVTNVSTHNGRPYLRFTVSGRAIGQLRRASFKYKVNSGIFHVSSMYNGTNSVNVGKTLSGSGEFEFYYVSPAAASTLAFYLNGRNLFDVQIDELKDEPINTLSGIGVGGDGIVFTDKVHYLLASPVITPIAHAGLLNSNSNGTVYFEPAIKDIITYTDKAEISDTDYPISSIESIEKNGIAVNPATAVIAEGGLSLTHPDLEANDEVELIYSYNKESTGRGMRLLFYNKA